MEDEHERIYQNVVAQHEQYMERAVPYKSLLYVLELVEAGRLQEIRAVRLQDGRVTGSKREVPEEAGQNFWKAAQPGAAVAQRNHAEDCSGVAKGVHGGAERGHTPQQGDAGGKKGGGTGSSEKKEPGDGRASGGGIPQPRGTRAGWSGGPGQGGVAHRQALGGVGGQGAGPV